MPLFGSALLVACVGACAGPETTDPGGDSDPGPCAADEIYVDGLCLPGEAPTGWVCATVAYNAADGCHCDCGTPDPDCDLSGQVLIGCEALVDPVCTSFGRCQGDDPPVWQCANALRDAGDGCDCGCAEIDPDCPVDPIITDCARDNCSAGYEVDPSDVRLCMPMSGPAGWSCESILLENGWCDCGCGADDPECSPAYTIDNCLIPSQCPVGEEPDPADPAQCIPS